MKKAQIPFRVRGDRRATRGSNAPSRLRERESKRPGLAPGLLLNRIVGASDYSPGDLLWKTSAPPTSVQ
jgi:hypothetical protein